jgi:hypothetical protein
MMKNKQGLITMLLITAVIILTACPSGPGNKTPYPDPTKWTLVEDSEFGESQNGIFGITYGGGKFVAVGHDGNMSYSTNGITWEPVEDSKFDTLIRAITYGGGKFVAVGSGGKIAYSGTIWQ